MSSVSHIRHIRVLILLSMCLSATAQSQKPPAAVESAELANTGAITGTVVNENGQPLPNASVTIHAIGSVNQGRFATTDREGRFQLSGLERFAYQVSAFATAYTLPARDLFSTQPAYYRVGDSVHLVLVKGGVITGTVRTPGGEPVVGVHVQAQMIRNEKGQPSRYRASFGMRRTDDRGMYRIYGLPTGTYVVMAGGGGSFFPDISAYATDAPTYSPGSARDLAAEINVLAGEETSNVDIRYRGEPGHMVSGVAVGPQGVDQGFSITLSSKLDDGSQWTTSSFQGGNSGFVIYGVPDGDYSVIAQSYSQTGEAAFSDPQRIKVRGADITGLELTTKPLAVISGTVLLEDSKASECKGKRRPLFTETLVFAWHNEKVKPQDQPQFVWSLGGPRSPDKDGNFVLRNLAPGQYHFIPNFSAKYWYLSSISLPSASAGIKATAPKRSVDAARNWTVVKSGDRVSGLVINLAEGAASLRGKITTDESKNAPEKLYAYLVPAEPDKAEDVLRFFASPIPSDGSITLNNLAPGRYWIVARPAFDGPLSPLTKLRLPDETETRATLRREAEAAKNALEFKPCQNVTNYQLALKSEASAGSKN